MNVMFAKFSLSGRLKSTIYQSTGYGMMTSHGIANYVLWRHRITWDISADTGWGGPKKWHCFQIRKYDGTYLYSISTFAINYSQCKCAHLFKNIFI